MASEKYIESAFNELIRLENEIVINKQDIALIRKNVNSMMEILKEIKNLADSTPENIKLFNYYDRLISGIQKKHEFIIADYHIEKQFSEDVDKVIEKINTVMNTLTNICNIGIDDSNTRAFLENMTEYKNYKLSLDELYEHGKNIGVQFETLDKLHKDTEKIINTYNIFYTFTPPQYKKTQKSSSKKKLRKQKKSKRKSRKVY